MYTDISIILGYIKTLQKQVNKTEIANMLSFSGTNPEVRI